HDRGLRVIRKEAAVHEFPHAGWYIACALRLLKVFAVEVLHVTRPLAGRDRLPVESVDGVERGGIETIVVVAVQHFKRISPHPDDRPALLLGVLDGLGRATAAARRLAVPNGDEDVAMIHHIP